MSFNLFKIYYLLPVFFQNFVITIKGFLIRKQRYGGNFKLYCQEFEKNQKLSLKELNKIQLEKFKKIIDHVYKNVPYYKRIFDENGINPDIKNLKELSRIPFLKKETIKKYKKDFIAQNIPKRKLIPYTTGGTTGSPLTLYVTNDSIRYNFACSEIRVKKWAGVKSKDKIATFLGKTIVSPKQKKPPFWRYNKSYNQILFSSFHLNEKNFDFYLKKINDFRPKIIQGYISIIHQFAKYALNGNKKINSPKAILLSSETLFNWQRQEIEKAFGSKVFNGYSLAEFVAFISECEQNNLHISPDYGLIELHKIKNEENKYEIIGTTLFNYAMPLIRYKTGDIVTLSEKKTCPCGCQLPIIKSIEGRSDSMIVTPDNKYISPASLSLVFQSANNIKEAQLIQISKNKIILRLIKEKGFSNKDSQYLLKELKQRLGYSISINIDYVQKIERTKSGKYQFIISKFYEKKK